jgi:hypothetical protein
LRLEEAFDMRSHLLLGTAAIALAVAAAPAHAQLAPGDIEIEGPMSAVEVYAEPQTDITPQGARTSIGQMKVLGVTVKVLKGALIHTPTHSNAPEVPEADRLTLGDFAKSAPALPGRGEDEGGFDGGTAIVVGESIGGQVYVSDVFSDMFEHVVVGEATGVQTDALGVRAMTINNMKIVRSTDRRMPAAPPINGFGLRIRPSSITKGTLAAAEGYYVPSQNTLYYHSLEADSAELARTEVTQVGILRADCRIRGGGRDELEVRGGVAYPANATVQIRFSDPTINNPHRSPPSGWSRRRRTPRSPRPRVCSGPTSAT